MSPFRVTRPLRSYYNKILNSEYVANYTLAHCISASTVYNIHRHGGKRLREESQMSKDVKIGVLAGDAGTDSEYQWNVLILDRAYEEAIGP